MACSVGTEAPREYGAIAHLARGTRVEALLVDCTRTTDDRYRAITLNLSNLRQAVLLKRCLSWPLRRDAV